MWMKGHLFYILGFNPIPLYFVGLIVPVLAIENIFRFAPEILRISLCFGKGKPSGWRYVETGANGGLEMRGSQRWSQF